MTPGAAVAPAALAVAGPSSAVAALAAWAASAGTPGALAFGGAYAAASVAGLPVWPLTLAVGLVYGPWRGLLVAVPGSLLGALLAFLAGRHLLRGAAGRFVARRPRLAALDAGVGREGFRVVLLLRLTLLPYNLLNYAFAVSRVRPADYALGSLLGSLPLTLAWLHAGALLPDAAALAEGRRPPLGAAGASLGALGLLAAAAAALLIRRAARRALDAPAAGAPRDPGGAR